MKIIRIPKNLVISDLEKLYGELSKLTETTNLLLPDEILSRDFAIEPLVMQFVFSWIRHKHAGKIVIDYKGDAQGLADIVIKNYIYPSIIMAWRNGVCDRDMLDLREAIRPINRHILQSMQELKIATGSQKGFRSLLTCFDHLAQEQGLLNCFYFKGEFIRVESTLANSLSPVLDYVSSFVREGKADIQRIKADLVGIIHELMSNTEEWARTNINSQALRPNVRGVLIKFTKKTKRLLTKNYENHPGMADFFDNLSPTSKGEIYFIELSVFDSGIGFVSRFTGKSNESFEAFDQVQIIKKCLTKHHTSDRSLHRESKGLGLNRILNLLDKKGLIMIRTAGVFLFRNLKRYPHVEPKDAENMELYDWQTNSSDNYSEMSSATGSVVSIVYPIAINL